MDFDFTEDQLMLRGLARTAGEFRFSGYLPWQAVYAEYWSAPVNWPDFGADELREAAAVYARRVRKFGGLAPESAAEAGDPS